MSRIPLIWIEMVSRRIIGLNQSSLSRLLKYFGVFCGFFFKLSNVSSFYLLIHLFHFFFFYFAFCRRLEEEYINFATKIEREASLTELSEEAGITCPICSRNQLPRPARSPMQPRSPLNVCVDCEKPTCQECGALHTSAATRVGNLVQWCLRRGCPWPDDSSLLMMFRQIGWLIQRESCLL